MNRTGWLPIICILILAGACTTQPAAMTQLPTARVEVTHPPSAEEAMGAFLAALQKDDFGAMYGMLSIATQKSIKPEDFARQYNDALNSLSAPQLDFQILSEQLSHDEAQVGFRIVYHTVLFGDIQRDLTGHFTLEQGQWRLDWNEGLILPELAGGNRLETKYEIPARGDIYDRNGQLLVTLKDAYALGITPGQLTDKSESAIVAALAQVCHRTPQSITTAYAHAAPEWYVPICEAAVDETTGILNLHASGLTASPYTARFYLDQGIAPQVVGYASFIQKEQLDGYLRQGYRSDEKVGQMGIEYSMEKYLAGRHGGMLLVVDAHGQTVKTLASRGPQPADSVYLTIDHRLQLEVQKTLQNFTGAAVVLERDTGRVLAMASSPEFDPNLFNPDNFNSHSLLGDLMSDPATPLLNRAAQGQYPLGSAFKPITMAAALESGLYLPQTTYDCQYAFTELQPVGGPILYDWTWMHCQDRVAAGQPCDTADSQPSGLLTLQEGLMRSCDPYFWHIGFDLYKNNRAGDIAAMAKAFGLGAPTGIDVIDEKAGNIPTPGGPIDATNEAIGQGDILVTPLQVARFVAAIGNDGTLYRPQLIEKIQSVNSGPLQSFKPEAAGKLPISAADLRAIQDAMQMVVKDPRGTAYYRFLGFDLPFAGKTGTAQTGEGLQPHAWFVGYTDDLASSGKPDIAIAVVLEYQGEGSDWAAPVFRGIVQAYYYGQTQTNPPWGTWDTLYTPTPIGGVPTKVHRGKQPTPTP